ncbi:hypothetical protein MFIFM68171_10938 [Madurella fahalii]|uniref:Uncharacterized protein n=1 Tax=Madurella fahalii TaxID=1157608 RepID=A0ABQ0GSM6_9PEZI
MPTRLRSHNPVPVPTLVQAFGGAQRLEQLVELWLELVIVQDCFDDPSMSAFLRRAALEEAFGCATIDLDTIERTGL